MATAITFAPATTYGPHNEKKFMKLLVNGEDSLRTRPMMMSVGQTSFSVPLWTATLEDGAAQLLDQMRAIKEHYPADAPAPSSWPLKYTTRTYETPKEVQFKMQGSRTAFFTVNKGEQGIQHMTPVTLDWALQEGQAGMRVAIKYHVGLAVLPASPTQSDAFLSAYAECVLFVHESVESEALLCFPPAGKFLPASELRIESPFVTPVKTAAEDHLAAAGGGDEVVHVLAHVASLKRKLQDLSEEPDATPVKSKLREMETLVDDILRGSPAA